jgi:hypothetical protein
MPNAMFPRHSFPSPLLAVGMLLGLVLPAKAELAATSPFLPPGGQAVAAPVNTVPLELRGVNSTRSGTMFSIFDPVKKSGTWVKINETGYDFAVKKYDADTDTVTIEYQGRTQVLQMRTPKIASSGNAVAPLPAPAPIIAGPVPNQNPTPRVVASPTPATEAARLADWQAEIQRRRDMRAQAATQPPGPQPQASPASSGPQVQPKNVPNPRPRARAGN